jgi:hypothetical protein
MERTAPARVMIVTDRATAEPGLLDALRARARRGAAQFRVLVPNPASAEWHPLHPERHDKLQEAERALMRALPAIQDAVDGAVWGRVSVRHDPMTAIEEMLCDEPFDEIILALSSAHLDRLARRVAHLGLPVTTVCEP